MSSIPDKPVRLPVQSTLRLDGIANEEKQETEGESVSEWEKGGFWGWSV